MSIVPTTYSLSTLRRRTVLAMKAAIVAAVVGAIASSASPVAAHGAPPRWHLQRVVSNPTPWTVTPAEHAATRVGMTRREVRQLYGMPGFLGAWESARGQRVREVVIYPCAAVDGGQTYVYYRHADHHWRVAKTTWFGR